jgi:hypothetical protein
VRVADHQQQRGFHAEAYGRQHRLSAGQGGSRLSNPAIADLFAPQSVRTWPPQRLARAWSGISATTSSLFPRPLAWSSVVPPPC